MRHALRLACLATILWAAPASGAPPAAEHETGSEHSVRELEKKVRPVLPSGWALRTRRLPEGLTWIIVGPSERGRRIVLAATTLSDNPPTDAPSPHGPPPALKRLAGPDHEVRYLVSGGDPGILLTVLAPKGTMERAYQRALAVASALKASRG